MAPTPGRHSRRDSFFIFPCTSDSRFRVGRCGKVRRVFYREAAILAAAVG
ncbi:hypothetical protein DDI_0100 [Dickeya dianthicola RNS04.9]|nr:hypothetical protein DDI_0100 [Dickeya dianthicola RNS04.9]